MSCNQPSHPDTPAEYLSNTQVSAADYTRDSLYLAETFYGYIREDYGKSFAILGIRLFDENTRVYVDTIIYSPDLLKIVGLVVIKSTIDSLNLIEPWSGEDKNHFFDGFGLVGYRLFTYEPWKVYPYQPYHVSVFPSSDKVVHALRRHFFKDIHTYTTVNSLGEIIPIRFNISDTNFWEGPFWQQNKDDGGLYPFQAFPYYPYNGELPYLEIVYSDSLLRLYRSDE